MPNNPYLKLKKDYEHLLGRTWDLFNFGRDREHKLTEALANSWKNFERIAESDDPESIRKAAEGMRDYTARILKETSHWQDV